jgi:hypothetical protein
MFLRKKLKLGVKMVEFSDGVFDLDARKYKACFFPLTVYISMKDLAVVGVFIQFQNRH